MDFTYIFIIVGLLFILLLLFFVFNKAFFSLKTVQIKRLFAEKNYDLLIEILEKALTKDERNQVAHFYLSKVYFAQGDMPSALSHANKLTVLDKYDNEVTELKVRESLANIYLSIGQLEEAQKEFLLILEKRPNDHYYNYYVGDIFYQRDYRDRAKDYFRKALELNPNHTDSLFRLGQIYYSYKKNEIAFAHMSNCVKIDPNYYGAYYYMGLIYVDSMNYLQALTEFDKSLKNINYRLMSLFQKGRVYYLLSDVDRAIIEFERGIFYIKENDGIALSLRYLLAACYEKKRDLPQAVSQWELIAAVKNDYNDVKSKLEEYGDIRLDDHFKDFMTASNSRFDEMCKDIIMALGYGIIDYSSSKGVVSTILATEGIGKWQSDRRNRVIIKIYRSGGDISVEVIRDLLSRMKSVGAHKSIIITTGQFSRLVYEYADTRPVYLYDKNKLSDFLKRAYANK